MLLKFQKKNFSALTRLDMNRASSQVATKLNANIDDIKNVIIWGNHSDTQVPDIEFATVNQSGNTKNVKDCVDEKWVSNEFVPTIKFRGKSIIEARGSSSALSAANAVKDCMIDWLFLELQRENMCQWRFGVKENMV